MRCLMCESFSLSHICLTCKENFLQPSLYKRKILGDVEVISFYKYSEIEKLLHTKHTDLGYYIFTILAEMAFEPFAKAFSFSERVASIGVDENSKSGYSHTALLSRSLTCKDIRPHFSKLRAKNSISYSGKSREYRLMHPREFLFTDIKEKNIIVVDDIITTGFTLSQSVQSLRKAHKEVLFCLTLADSSQ